MVKSKLGTLCPCPTLCPCALGESPEGGQALSTLTSVPVPPGATSLHLVVTLSWRTLRLWHIQVTLISFYLNWSSPPPPLLKPKVDSDKIAFLTGTSYNIHHYPFCFEFLSLFCFKKCSGLCLIFYVYQAGISQLCHQGPVPSRESPASFPPSSWSDVPFDSRWSVPPTPQLAALSRICKQHVSTV